MRKDGRRWILRTQLSIALRCVPLQGNEGEKEQTHGNPLRALSAKPPCPPNTGASFGAWTPKLFMLPWMITVWPQKAGLRTPGSLELQVWSCTQLSAQPPLAHQLLLPILKGTLDLLRKGIWSQSKSECLSICIQRFFISNMLVHVFKFIRCCKTNH